MDIPLDGSTSPLFLGQVSIYSTVGFCGGRKTEGPGENPWCKDARIKNKFKPHVTSRLLVFVEEGKPEDLDNNHWSKDENQE